MQGNKQKMRAFQGGIVAAILLLPLFAWAYKSPGQPTGFVNDFAKVLTADQVLELNKELAQYSLRGDQNEISVVTLPSLGGDDIESYASTLFKEWGIGKKGKDNGVLLLIAVQDHKMRIEVGYGAEALLTDAQSGVIIRTILTPAFRAGDFYGGISQAVREIAKALSGDTTDFQDAGNNGDASQSNPPDAATFFIIGWFVLGFLRGIAVALGKTKSWWAGGLIGGMFGLVLSLYFGFLYVGLFAIVGLALLGLIFDFLVSRVYERNMHMYHKLPWWLSGGGRGGSGGSGGFGGFGGGGSGGGGSSGGW